MPIYLAWFEGACQNNPVLLGRDVSPLTLVSSVNSRTGGTKLLGIALT